MKYLYLARTFREKGLSLFTTRDFEQMAGLSRSSAWGALGRYTKQGLVKSPKKILIFFPTTRIIHDGQPGIAYFEKIVSECFSQGNPHGTGFALAFYGYDGIALDFYHAHPS